MSTYYQEMKEKYPDRPWIGRPTWELRNMARALGMLPWLNSADDWKRKAEVERELKLRRSRG
jgi:hypothetical protein